MDVSPAKQRSTSCLPLNVQCDKKARNKTFPLESLWRFRGGQNAAKKFPPGIGELATLERGILTEFLSPKKVSACVSHKGVLSD
jgi:hypothetical protein